MLVHVCVLEIVLVHVCVIVPIYVLAPVPVHVPVHVFVPVHMKPEPLQCEFSTPGPVGTTVGAQGTCSYVYVYLDLHLHLYLYMCLHNLLSENVKPEPVQCEFSTPGSVGTTVPGHLLVRVCLLVFVIVHVCVEPEPLKPAVCMPSPSSEAFPVGRTLPQPAGKVTYEKRPCFFRVPVS